MAASGAVGATALTSVLEELGWAGGGLALAIGAFGRRGGVAVLGLVWAAWHLIPAFLHIGLFPELERAPLPMLATFTVTCMIYRELLTRLRERARTWWAAAAGHAAPNMLLAALMAAGLGGFDRLGHWPFFPAPGGLVFLLLALAATWVIRSPHHGRDRPIGAPPN
jgi:nitroreductase